MHKTSITQTHEPKWKMQSEKQRGNKLCLLHKTLLELLYNKTVTVLTLLVKYCRSLMIIDILYLKLLFALHVKTIAKLWYFPNKQHFILYCWCAWILRKQFRFKMPCMWVRTLFNTNMNFHRRHLLFSEEHL